MTSEEHTDMYDSDHYAYGWGRTRLIQEIDFLREQHKREAETIKEMSEAIYLLLRANS